MIEWQKKNKRKQKNEKEKLKIYTEILITIYSFILYVCGGSYQDVLLH